jgi:hypothetical protein
VPGPFGSPAAQVATSKPFAEGRDPGGDMIVLL